MKRIIPSVVLFAAACTHPHTTPIVTPAVAPVAVAPADDVAPGSEVAPDPSTFAWVEGITDGWTPTSEDGDDTVRLDRWFDDGSALVTVHLTRYDTDCDTLISDTSGSYLTGDTTQTVAPLEIPGWSGSAVDVAGDEQDDPSIVMCRDLGDDDVLVAQIYGADTEPEDVTALLSSVGDAAAADEEAAAMY